MGLKQVYRAAHEHRHLFSGAIEVTLDVASAGHLQLLLLLWGKSREIIDLLDLRREA